MDEIWRVPSGVRQRVGAELDDILADAHDDPARGCQLCGERGSVERGRVDTLVVLLATDTTETLMGLAHASCAPPDGVVDTHGSVDDIPRDTVAILGERGPDIRPAAVFVLQPGVRGRRDLGGGIADIVTTRFLAYGFDLLRTADESAVRPAHVAGFVVAIDASSVALRTPEGVTLYSMATEHVDAHWLTLATRDRSVLVVAGSELGIAPGVGPSRLADAVAAGRVVTAVVAVSDTR